MKVEVATGIEQLKQQFSSSAFNVRDDGNGGADGDRSTAFRLGPR